MCKQQSYFRDFRGLKSFGQHLNRSRPLVKSISDNAIHYSNSNAIDNNYIDTEASSFASTLFNLSEITTTYFLSPY